MSDADNPSGESGDVISMFEAALDRSAGVEPKSEPKSVPINDTKSEASDELPDIDPADLEKEEQPEAEVKKYTVKVDGKDVEVAEDELLKGYSRQQDYTKKTMEVAAQRQQLDQAANQMQQERQQYQAQLNQLTQALGQQLSNQPEPDWSALLENDPIEYLKQQHLFQERQVAYQKASQEQARTQEQTQIEQAKYMQQMLTNEREQLIANLPAWSDTAKASAEQAAISKHLIERGFSQEQVAQITDHKTVILAREAMLYRQMVAKAKETTKKVEALPPRMQKPGAPRATDGRTNDMQALKKSGSVADATALFEKMF